MRQFSSLSLQIVMALFIIFSYSNLKAQEGVSDHNHTSFVTAKRIKINQPTTEQLYTLVQSGIDLKCGAQFMGDALYLELGQNELEKLNESGISYTVTINDLIEFNKQRNETALPFAIGQLALEKQRVHQDQETRSLSTTSTTISNIIQYEGATEIDWATPQNFSLGSMGGCFTYDEVLAQLDLMRSLYPNLISVKKDASLAEDGSGTPIVTHGNSFTNGGQYDTWNGQTIYYVRISDNPDADEANEPESFFSGMTHSREVSSMMNLMYFMWYVLENYDADPDIKNLVDNNEMYLVPVANPDGLMWNEQIAPAGGGQQRKNLEPSSNTGNNSARGVDLNRNYSYLWGEGFGGSSNMTDNQTYRGTAPFSEPETQIVEQFVANHPNVKTALNHHATSNLLPHAYNGESGAPSSGREEDYAQFCQDLTRFNRYIYGEAPNILTIANGDMSDWMLGGPPRTNSDGSVSSGSGSEILALAPENGDPEGLEADPDFSSGFWPSPDQIVYIAKRAMRMNLINALYAGKTAQLHDLTPSNITNSSGNLEFAIEYLGMTLSDLTLTVTPVSANINSIGTIPVQTGWSKQEQRNISVSYQLGTVAADDPIEFEVTLSNDTHIIYQAILTKYYTPTLLFEDDPDTNGISNWTASADWTTTTDAYSGTTAITNDATPPYANNRNVTLTLNNALNLSAVNTAVIQFYAKWDIERNFDYAQLQASTDGGTTWNALSGKYTKPGATLSTTRYSPVAGSGSAGKNEADRNNQPDGEPIYEGFNDGKWVLEEIEISGGANAFVAGASNLQLRFVFDSEINNNSDGYTTTFDGFTFDDFKVLSYDLDRSCLQGLVDTYPYEEGFETGLGLWTQNTEDDGDLTLGSEETPSNTTGPNQASEGTYYYFAEATDNNIGLGPNAEVIITSPCYDLTGIIANFDFDYHMFGNNTGSLEVEISPSGSTSWTSLFSISGQQSANGNDWQTGSLDLSTYTDSTVQLRFIITTGGGFASDIAIDNLIMNPVDTTDPTAVCQDITVSLGSDGTVTILGEDIDNGSTDNIGIESFVLDIDTFTCDNIGTNNVVLTITDFSGNTDTCSAVVTVDPYTTPPENLMATNIAGTTATLQWDMAASEDYEVRFRESGTSTWTTINVLINEYDLTGLDTVTEYEAQVRANCTTGNTPFSTSIFFTTTELCSGTTISVFPYAEGFNSNIGDWTQDTNDDGNWTIDNDGTPSPGTGPGSPFEGSDYLYIEASDPSQVSDPNAIGFPGQQAILTSPCLDLTNFSSSELTFRYHMFSTDNPGMGDLDVEISEDGRQSWSNIFTISGNQGNSWNLATIALNDFTGNVISIRIIGTTGSTFRSDIAIDDLQISAGTTDYTYDAGSWTPEDPSGVSASVDNMFVITGSPTLTDVTTINNVSISAGATLNLSSNILNIAGDLTNSGSLNAQNGTINVNGTTNQIISGNPIEVNTLELNNSTSVTLNAEISINELLNLNQGNLVSSGNLTMLSNASETAMINEVTTGTITGDVNVERFIPARRAFRLVSSSVTTTTSINENWQEGVNNTGINFPADNIDPSPGYGTHITGSNTGLNGFDATNSGNPSLFIANNTNQSFNTVSNTDVRTLTAGLPYLLLVRGSRDVDLSNNMSASSDTRLRASGTLFTGPLTISGGNLNHNAGEFNFFGNPYQASVDMNDVVAGSSNINPNQYYIWDPSLGTRGAFVTVLLTGTGSSNTAGSAANHFIQPYQAAFLSTAATVGDNSTAISFEESYKSIGENTSVFFDGSTSDDNDPIVNNAHIIGQLYQTEALNNGDKLQDSFAILFSPDFSNGINLKDALKWDNIDENFGIRNGEHILSIEKRFLPSTYDIIQLEAWNYTTTNYTLKLTVSVLDGVTAYLVDTFENESISLSEGDENLIDFQVDPTNIASVAQDRFKIIFKENTLTIEDNDFEFFQVFPNPVDSDTVMINTNELTGEEIELSLTNLLGQRVMNKRLILGSNNEVNGFDKLTSGVYLLTLKNTNHNITQKLIIK